jgi:hypothetical protein
LGLGLAGFFPPLFGASFLADFTCEGGLSLFRRKPERPPAEEWEAEVAALRERVARLEADLELLRKRNAELAKEASPAPKENAVLRYGLFNTGALPFSGPRSLPGSSAGPRWALASWWSWPPPGVLRLWR